MFIKKLTNETAEYSDEIIVYNTETKTISVLNKTATCLWKIMNETESYDDLKERFITLFVPKPPRDVFEKDFQRLISNMCELGMIEIVESEEENL